MAFKIMANFFSREQNTNSIFFSYLINVLSGLDHLLSILFLLFINDIFYLIKYFNILLFADDPKTYNTINFVINALQLQLDLYHFQEWHINNGMDLVIFMNVP